VKYLLDTTLLIDHVHGRPEALALVEWLFSQTNDLYTCDVIVAEALSRGDAAEVAAITALIDVLEYVSTSPDAARRAGADRRRRNVTSYRSLPDAIIAGVAWSLDLTVVTRNARDFEKLSVPVLAYT
jgi:predicted nucleic acid-binding protein